MLDVNPIFSIFWCQNELILLYPQVFKDFFIKFKHFFSNSRSFQGPSSFSRSIPGLCEPWNCKWFTWARQQALIFSNYMYFLGEIVFMLILPAGYVYTKYCSSKSFWYNLLIDVLDNCSFFLEKTCWIKWANAQYHLCVGSWLHWERNSGGSSWRRSWWQPPRNTSELC